MQAAPRTDALASLLQAELQREMTAWQATASPPYFVSFRVDDQQTWYLEASFGAVSEHQNRHYRIFTPMVRVGDWQFDNYHPTDDGPEDAETTYLPLEDEPDAIRQVVWLSADAAYRAAVSRLAAVSAGAAVRVRSSEESSDYTGSTPVQYAEAPADAMFTARDEDKWLQRLCRYSAVGKEFPELVRCDASLSVRYVRKYYVSSEGSVVVQNQPYATLSCDVTARADDGMQLPLFVQWFAFRPDRLPDDKTVTEAVRGLVRRLQQLQKAPVAEPYSGPALMSADAAGVFFHEIFGHRVEGQRLKDENDAQTFRHMLGESVLPADISVTMKPRTRQFGSQDLNGYYLYDDEGMPADEVDIVRNGILQQFLMSRTPVPGISGSNGHGRAAAGYNPVTRQSNLFVTSDRGLDENDLRQMLIEEVKAQGKTYGYFFTKVSGGYTQTSRYSPNAFNISPLEVFRIYPDGRPDELVRGVDLIGTPLSMLSQIAATGGTPQVFTGMCGAESGYVPVTCIAPMLFVKRIETQKQAVGQELPPLLKAPQPGDRNRINLPEDDRLLQAMQDELHRNLDSLALQDTRRPFLVQYTLQRGTVWRTQSTLGSPLYTMEQPVQSSSVKTLLGDYQRTSADNALRSGAGLSTPAVLEADYDAVRRLLWLKTDAAYKDAILQWQAKQTQLQQMQLPEEELAIPDLMPADSVTSRAALPAFRPDLTAWSEKMKRVSRVFRQYPQIQSSFAGMEVYAGTYYTASSEGVLLQQPSQLAVASVTASARTADGLNITDRLSYYGRTPADFPSEEVMAADAAHMASQLLQTGEAGRMDENYTGPVLIEGMAAAKYLAQGMFLSQGQGLITYRPSIRQTATALSATTEDRLQHRVMPTDLSVIAMPYLNRYEGQMLWGSYSVDADGIAPDSTLVLIENGMLRHLLAGRTPTAAVRKATGHLRYSYNPQNISTRVLPGVLLCRSDAGLTADSLKNMLLRAAREEGYRYGYIVRTIPGGRTELLYRTDVTDGSETLVRAGVLSDVTFKDLKNILGVTEKTVAHNMLWSDTPVSFICPEGILFGELNITKENMRKAGQPPAIPGPLDQ